MEPTLKEHDRPQPALHDHPYTDLELQALEDAEVGYGDLFKPQPVQPVDPDDPMEVVSKAQVLLSKISNNLWQEEDIRKDEIPEEIQDEIRESGAITVSLRDVRQSIGKDRQDWKVALEAELQSLRDTAAIFPVQHVPRGHSVLPMKLSLIHI